MSKEHLTGAALAWAQREHGICSDRECDQPIAHICYLCGKRVCKRHTMRGAASGAYLCHNTPHFAHRMPEGAAR